MQSEVVSMPSNEVWGDEALDVALSSLPPVPPPSRRHTPLEQEVDALAARAETVDAASDVLADPGGSWYARVAVVMVDALMARDKRALDALDVELRRLHRRTAAAEHQLTADDQRDPGDVAAPTRARLCAQLGLEFVRAALERVAPVATAIKISGTQYESFLRVLADHPGSNSRQMAEALGVRRAGSGGRSTRSRPLDASQLSRIGKRLLEDGLVFAQRGGSGLSWELTPRGRLVIDRLLQAHEDSDHSVKCVVVAPGGFRAKEVAAVLSKDEPRELVVVGAGDQVTYARQDASDEQDRVEATPVTVGAALADLLDVAGSRPQSFSLANGVRYKKEPVMSSA
jgi:hypothetical protein